MKARVKFPQADHEAEVPVSILSEPKHLYMRTTCLILHGFIMYVIHVPLSPTTPYFAPIKEKLLLHAVHAVVEEKYTHSSSTVVSLVFSLLSVLCSLPWKHSMQSTHNLDRKND